MGDDKDLETPLWTPQASTLTPAAKAKAAVSSASANTSPAGVPPGLAAVYFGFRPLLQRAGRQAAQLVS